MKKKILLVLLIMIISTISQATLQVTAASGINIDDIDYSYEGIPAEKAEKIVKAMFGIEDDFTIQPRSILCIFGHSIGTGGITMIEHKVSSTNPRCRETWASVELCTRDGCSYFKIISEVSGRIVCC